MALQLLRRLGVFALTALIASVCVFLLLAVLPGDPARAQLGLDASDAEVAALRERLGLNRPPHVQYLAWLSAFVRGDMGTSYSSGLPVTPLVLDALAVSLILVAAGIAVAVIIAVPLGTMAAYRRSHWDGLALSGLSQLGVAVPSFLAGLLLITVFAVQLELLPSSGWVPPADGFGQFLRHLLLPALALGLVRGAILARYQRSAVLEVQREDFMRTAQATGLTPAGALWRHGLRNALVPVITVAGVEFSALLVGAVVVETVFVLPGMGSLLLRAVGNRDLVQVQAIVMVIVLLVLVINLIVDVVHTLVDPRLRRAA